MAKAQPAMASARGFGATKGGLGADGGCLKVVVLCGGKGTRIRDVSEELPKPMIPIGEYPIVKHIMDIYGAFGHHEFILCLGYLGWRIKHYFLHYRAEHGDVQLDFRDIDNPRYLATTEMPPWNVILAQTGIESMTGARIMKVRRYVENETFMLTYGDGVGDIDIDGLLEFHRSHGRLVTITSVHPPSRFGELVVEDGVVASFHEKPQAAGGLINGGFLVCEPGVFDYLSHDESCVFETDALQNIAADHQLMSYEHQGFWMPMDTSREYVMLNELWNRGEAPWHPGNLRR